jgi:hypothetical protein
LTANCTPPSAFLRLPSVYSFFSNMLGMIMTRAPCQKRILQSVA